MKLYANHLDEKQLPPIVAVDNAKIQYGHITYLTFTLVIKNPNSTCLKIAGLSDIYGNHIRLYPLHLIVKKGKMTIDYSSTRSYLGISDVVIDPHSTFKMECRYPITEAKKGAVTIYLYSKLDTHIKQEFKVIIDKDIIN